MKKLLVFAVVLSSLSFCIAAEKAVVTASVLNVRVKPSPKSDTLLQLKRGEEVVVLEKGEQWTAIRPPENSSLYVSSPLIENGKLKSSANLRAGSGVNFQSLGIMPEGTPVTVLEDKNSWSRIAVPAYDVKCYVATAYLKFSEVPAAPAQAAAKPAVPVKKGDIVSFSEASRSKILANIVKGTEKNITFSGDLQSSSSKDHGQTYVVTADKRSYHLIGVIPSGIDLEKPVKVTGVSHIIKNWSYPVLVIEKITQQ